MEYDLEIDKAIEKINNSKARLVCIQLPDGLKPESKNIQEEIEKNTKAKVLIWFGSCYGACDMPDIKEVDLLIQWGHSKWKY
jgi:diphthamide biosynthesis enzyme Dph1/Dph2-like protein